MRLLSLRRYLKVVFLSILCTIALSFVGLGYYNDWREWVYGSVVFLGPIKFVFFLIVFLVVELKKDYGEDANNRFPQKEIEEFTIESQGRVIELFIELNHQGKILLKINFWFIGREDKNLGKFIEFDVTFERKGESKVGIRGDKHARRIGRQYLDVLAEADPPIIPIKWKSGVLTISDAGMEYTEGPYDLGPVADDGIVGNLTIVEGLKSVVDEIEAIWMASNRNGESKA